MSRGGGGAGKALSAPEIDKSYVGGPGVLCKKIQRSSKLDFTPSDMETLKVREIEGGNPFRRMTTTPSVFSSFPSQCIYVYTQKRHVLFGGSGCVLLMQGDAYGRQNYKQKGD